MLASLFTHSHTFLFLQFFPLMTPKLDCFFYSFLFCKKKKKFAFWLFNSGVCNKILGTFQTVKKKPKQ